MSDDGPSSRSEVRQLAGRARYDRETIHAILDAGLVAHVGFCADGQAYVIPMSYGRRGDEIVMHAAPASRLVRVAKAGQPLCVTVTLVDGVVVARTVAHHSMNYRSVVAFGVAREITDDQERIEAVGAILEQVVTGRGEEVPPTTARDLKGTVLLAVKLEEASAKIRSGPPVEPARDRDSSLWAGEIPLDVVAKAPVTDASVSEDVAVPGSVREWGKRRG